MIYDIYLTINYHHHHHCALFICVCYRHHSLCPLIADVDVTAENCAADDAVLNRAQRGLSDVTADASA